ncbi:MAG: ion transporter [Idiomarina sp.]|nr:ion transporter [Idiomarina sp.]
MRFKKFLALELRPDLREENGLSRTNFVVIVLILLGALLAILETEPVIRDRWGSVFVAFEGALFLFFLAEYVGRVYTANHPDLAGNVSGRVRYMFTFWSLLDLLVLISFVLMLGGSTLFLVRIFRLLRIVRIARLGRFSKAIDLILEAVSARKFEMALTFGIALGLMVLGAGVLYALEAENQPEVFGSIPRALWWSVATLTTVGYGDVVPVTVLGKIVAGITAMLGVGLVAMPAGILASAFSEAIQKRRQAEK